MSLQLQAMLRLKMGWASPSGPQHEVVLSSRVRLARNLTQLPFTNRANPKGLAAILDSTFKAAHKSPTLGKAAYLKLDELEPIEDLFLAERHLISRELAANPKSRGVVVGDREVLSVMVNEEDHLRLQAIDSGLCLDELWKTASAMETELARSLEFSFHPEWGYLTACPTNTGTAMRASALLHLPGLTLINQLNRILEGLTRVGMVVRGLYGEGTRVLGDFYQVSNATSMGKTEEEIVREISRGVQSLVERELEAQRHLSQGVHKLQMEDRVYRALGILSQARSLSFEETMQHLSYLRMALSLSWKLPVNLESLNELLVLAQPAHISMQAGREIGPQERDALRASMLRQRIKP